MTYFEAESMRQEMMVAMQFREMEPDEYKKVAKKYTAKQWVDCGKAILEKLEEDKVNLFNFLALVETVRKVKP